MMRFPALLLAKVAKARLARAFLSAAQPGRVLVFVDAADVLHRGSEHPVSHEKIRDIVGSTAPVIWIGGSEPLEHPGIAHLIRALAPSGHYIFLETDGILLRRRIHEFQPLPRVFLVVHWNMQKKIDEGLAVEGLRAARLSGFFTAIHSLVHENLDLGEFQRLRSFVLEKDVDGWLITGAFVNDAAAAQAVKARALLPNVAWRRLSADFERDLLAEESRVPTQSLSEGEKSETKAREESVNVT